MPRNPTPTNLLDGLRANTPDDDDALAAMFGPVADGERIVWLRVADLDANPFQHRSAGIADDDPALLELAADIAAHGIHQPLIVRTLQLTPRYQIAAGHRRHAAARLAGLEQVPCVVRALSDDAMLDVVFAENYHRTDINAIDRAQLIQLLADRGMTQQQIADRLSMSRPGVANALRLLKLPLVIQQGVVAGEISNRQAEALLPLATLPEEATSRLNQFSNLASIVERAKNGMNSDDLRSHVRIAVTQATKEIPEHWALRDFGDLAGIQQPTCAHCPRLIRHVETDRCTLPACWDKKSSAWQAIEQRAIIEATGLDLLPQSPGPGDYSAFYGSQLRTIGLPEIASEPPPLMCPNLRIRKGWKGFEFVCYHPGKSTCACLQKAEKEAKKDGNAQWKALRTQTFDALTAHLVTMPLDALRLLAHAFAKYEYRDQVPDWTAEQCAPAITAGLVGQFQPYDAATNIPEARKQMAKLLALAGVHAAEPAAMPKPVVTPAPVPVPVPVAPMPVPADNAPIEATDDPTIEALAATLRDVNAFIGEYIDPGDGLPTPASISAQFDLLDQALTVIRTLPDIDAPQMWRHNHDAILLRLAALNDRVQASYDQDQG